MCAMLSDTLQCHYTVRSSLRARRVSLRVVAGRLEVVLPKGVPESVVPEVLSRHERWIARHVPRVAGDTILDEMTLVPESVTLVATGESFGVVVGGSGTRGVSTGEVVNVPQDSCAAVAYLRKWLCGVAKPFFLTELDRCSALTGLKWKTLRVGLPRTRWGSCSCRGGVSLNARLLFFAPSLVRHVILHELCHLKQPDHSRAFHELLLSFDPLAAVHACQLRYARTAIPPWAA